MQMVGMHGERVTKSGVDQGRERSFSRRLLIARQAHPDGKLIRLDDKFTSLKSDCLLCLKTGKAAGSITEHLHQECCGAVPGDSAAGVD